MCFSIADSTRHHATRKSFVIATDGPVPIDNTLLNSFRPAAVRQRNSRLLCVRSATARIGPARHGNVGDRRKGRQSRKIDLRVIDGYLRYEKFEYPLYNVAGKIQIEERLVKLVGFRGTNANAGVGAVRWHLPHAVPTAPVANAYGHLGRIDLRSDQQSRLALKFDVANVPMDECTPQFIAAIDSTSLGRDLTQRRAR